MIRVSGTRNFQLKASRWSMRKRGRVPRIHIRTKTMSRALRTRMMGARKGSRVSRPKKRQPPRKATAVITATPKVAAYSARKKRANFIPLYSVW